MWDTGTSVGNVTGMTKACNSVDIKQQRPYRLVVGSEDFHAYFAEGPPFKTKHDLLVIITIEKYESYCQRNIFNISTLFISTFVSL